MSFRESESPDRRPLSLNLVQICSLRARYFTVGIVDLMNVRVSQPQNAPPGPPPHPG